MTNLELAEQSLTLYSRRGCHLCDDMFDLLKEFSDIGPFDVTVVDVDKDKELYDRFNTMVPVLYADERYICHYFLDLVALKTTLGITI